MEVLITFKRAVFLLFVGTILQDLAACTMKAVEHYVYVSEKRNEHRLLFVTSWRRLHCFIDLLVVLDIHFLYISGLLHKIEPGPTYYCTRELPDLQLQTK